MANILPVPESEQRVLNNLLRDLNEAYPDKVIVRFQQDHKNWYKKVTHLYKTIGYVSRDEFLAAYGFTVEQGKKGRSAVDIDAVMEELLSRYSGDRFVSSIDQLKEENPDLAPKFKGIQNKSQELFGMTFNKYLQEKGVFQSEESRQKAQREKLDSIVAELKRRYDGKEAPDSITVLKEENSDIKDIVNIHSLTEKAYGKKALEFFIEQGLVIKREKRTEKSEEKSAVNFRSLPADEKLRIVTEELKKRIAGDGERVVAVDLQTSIKNLKERYPDLPVQTIDAWSKKVYFGKNAKMYLIEQGILQTVREYCLSRVEHVDKLDLNKVKILMESKDYDIIGRLEKLGKKAHYFNSFPWEAKGYYFVIDTDNKQSMKGEYWDASYLIDPALKVKYIAKSNLIEIIEKEELRQKDRISSFAADDGKTKLNKAMKLFKTCVEKVEKQMDKTHDYNDPTVSTYSELSGHKKKSAVSPKTASEFFDEAVKWMNESDMGYDFRINPKDMRRWFEASYNSLLEKGKHYFNGEIGVRYPVGIAVAFMIYADPTAHVVIEFARDKWEWRGDYSASKRVCLEIANYGNDISVHYNRYQAYDM